MSKFNQGKIFILVKFPHGEFSHNVSTYGENPQRIFQFSVTLQSRKLDNVCEIFFFHFVNVYVDSMSIEFLI